MVSMKWLLYLPPQIYRSSQIDAKCLEDTRLKANSTTYPGVVAGTKVRWVRQQPERKRSNIQFRYDYCLLHLNFISSIYFRRLMTKLILLQERRKISVIKGFRYEPLLIKIVFNSKMLSGKMFNEHAEEADVLTHQMQHAQVQTSLVHVPNLYHENMP